MKHSTLALIALAAAFAGQSSLAVADEADVEILVVTGQRLAETDLQPVVAVPEPRATIDFSALDIVPPSIDAPTLELEPPRLELARVDDGSGQG